ncbi:MAG: GatB/YqeY domain-containing protein [bacterium]|nr:GatB/YqeY domain-containing protein [bacterium]
MSKLLEKINEELKQAMKSKDGETTSVLRMLISSIRNKEISLRSADKVELSDEQIIETIGSEIKKRKDSVEAYAKGGRQELALKETSEIKILEKYLPEQLSDEELEKIIKEIIAAGATDFGKVMGQTMARVKGKADGNRVGSLVKKLLVK